MTSWATPSGLDRADHARRSTEWVARQWRDPAAAVLPVSSTGRFPTAGEGRALRPVRPSEAFDSQRHRLLGLVDGAPVFTVEASVDGEAHDLREVGGRLSGPERDLAAAAAALTAWHRMEPLCPRCGGGTTVVNGGYVRHCAACGEDHFPRTDPAVIVAVVDDEGRLLLGGQAHWGHRVSVLAGFVEVGESAEQAIHREVAEEVGVRLGETCYFGSQPWPFPRSLMLAYFARAASTTITVDAEEISHAAWYRQGELADLLERGELALPGTSSIAARLIATWRSGRHPFAPG